MSTSPPSRRSRTTPATRTHELTVLGAVLMSDPDEAMPAAVRKLIDHAPEAFADPELAEIATAIGCTLDAGEPVHWATVAPRLCGEVTELKARSLLATVDAPLSVADASAARLWPAYQSRRLLSALTEARTMAENSDNPRVTADIAHKLAAVASELSASTLEADDLHFAHLLEDAADIVQEDLPPPVEIIGGLVTERSKFVIGSGSKSFKTWVTICMALAIAHGVKFWQRDTARSRVLYVNLELKGSTFKRRVKLLADAMGIEVDPGWFLHLPMRGKVAGLTIDVLIERIIKLAKSKECHVIVLDPVYKLNTEGDENSARDMANLFNQLDRLTTEADATVILNDHFGKGNQSEKDPLDAIRGSSAKGGDVDAAMVMRRHEVADCFRVDVIHRELAPVEPFVVGWDFPLMALRDDLDPESMKKAKAGRKRAHDPLDLLKHIENSTKENPVTVLAWADAAGLKRDTLRGYLPEMRKHRWIASVGEGTSARQFITEHGLNALQ